MSLLICIKLRAMNIIEFIEKYPTEESCKSDFKIQREFEGVKCRV